MISVRELRYFVAVAETLHFGQAAQREHIAQSALSRSITRLEAKLGVPLFTRTNRGVALTPAGRAALDDARTALVYCERLMRRARTHGQGLAGELAVGFIPAVDDTSRAVLGHFAAEHPEVDLTYRTEYNASTREGVTSGDLDVAFVLADPLRSDDLLAIPWCRVPLVALVGWRHPLARRGSVSPAELAEYPLAYPRVPGGDIMSRLLASTFESLHLNPVWVPVADSFMRDPVVVSESTSYVWMQSSQIRLTGDLSLLQLDPPLWVECEIVRRASNANPVLPEFLAYVADFTPSSPVIEADPSAAPLEHALDDA